METASEKIDRLEKALAESEAMWRKHDGLRTKAETECYRLRERCEKLEASARPAEHTYFYFRDWLENHEPTPDDLVELVQAAVRASAVSAPPSDERGDVAYLLRAIAHFKETRGKHAGPHDFGSTVCSSCEEAYIQAEEILDSVLTDIPPHDTRLANRILRNLIDHGWIEAKGDDLILSIERLIDAELSVSAPPSDERGELIATITYDPINQTSTTTRHVAVSDVSVGDPQRRGTMKRSQLIEVAMEWIQQHRPEPLKCIQCGQISTPYAAMSSAMAFCSVGPVSGHVYEYTILSGDDADRKDAERLADFAAVVIGSTR